MALNLTTAAAILKEDYLGPIRQQLNSATVLLAEVEKNSEDTEGKYAIIPVATNRNWGIGARGDGDTLPAAGNQTYDDLKVQMAYNYGRIKITGPTIKAMKSDRGSFARAIDSEMKGLVRDLKNDYNRQLFGDGTGALATCATTTSSNTVHLAHATDSCKFMNVGMHIDIVTTATGVKDVTNRSITAVDSANYTITIDGAAVSTTSAQSVAIYDSWNLEVKGLAVMIATTGTYQNINRATAGNEYWQANVSSNSGVNRSISDDLLQTVWDLCEEEGEGSNFLLLTTRGVRRKYVNTLTAQKRFVNNIDLKGGFSGIDFNGSAMAVDKDAPANKVWFLSKPNVAIYRMSDWEWMDEDGAILSRVSGEDAYEAVLFMYSQFGSDRCNCHGLLSDITQ